MEKHLLNYNDIKKFEYYTKNFTKEELVERMYDRLTNARTIICGLLLILVSLIFVIAFLFDLTIIGGIIK